MYLVTRQAQAATDREVAAPARAPLWGFGKGLAAELPELWGRLIDLDDQGGPEEIDGLLAELDSDDHEEFVALRGQSRRVARVVRTAEPAFVNTPLELRRDGVYVVTGGLGGIGLQAAHWLVARGARELAIVSRRGLQGDDRVARAAVAALEEAGARVEVFAADVASHPDMMRVMRSLQDRRRGVRGVLHAAGIASPTLVATTSAEHLHAVARAKLGGAWVLHELTRGLELDFFVCFSSVASMWGGAGMAAYAAANGFMDALATMRRARGLPASSIHWGGWAASGMVTADLESQALATGLGVVPAPQMLEALDTFIQRHATGIAISLIDWSVFRPLFEARRRRMLFEHIVVAATELDGTGTLRGELDALAPADRWSHLLDHVRGHAASVLGVADSAALDAQQGFFQAGMDSMMSVRLRNCLERSTGQALPATLAFEYPNVAAVAEYLGRELFSIAPVERGAAPAPPTPAPSDAATLDDMSEAELEAMLAAELDAGERREGAP
jgi:myxalamid-type polyketide synthase MxaE and MxaD